MLPKTLAMGALFAYATSPYTKDYQPMHVNFGIMPPLSEHVRQKEERQKRFCARARADLSSYMELHPEILDSLCI